MDLDSNMKFNSAAYKYDMNFDSNIFMKLLVFKITNFVIIW